MFMRASQSGWITPLCPAGHLPLKGGDWLHRRPTRSLHPERERGVEGEARDGNGGGWCRRSDCTPPGRFAATLPSKGRKAAVPYPLTLATQRHQPASSPRKTFKSMRLSTASERPEPEYCQKT